MHINCDGLILKTSIEEGWIIERPSNYREHKRYNKKVHMEARFLGADICNSFMASSFKSLIFSYYNKKLKTRIYNLEYLCACHLFMNKESYIVISRGETLLNEYRKNGCIESKKHSKYVICLDFFQIKRLEYFINIIFNHIMSI